MNLDKIGWGSLERLNVVVECPRGSSAKYEYDKDTGAIRVDRMLSDSVSFPCNYGFVPQTLCEDGDALDVCLVAPVVLDPGCVVHARPVGVMFMEDESGIDAKLLCVPTADVSRKYGHIKDVADLEPETLREIRHFFECYKQLDPNKWVKIKQELGNHEKACAEIEKARSTFKAKVADDEERMHVR